MSKMSEYIPYLTLALNFLLIPITKALWDMAKSIIRLEVQVHNLELQQKATTMELSFMKAGQTDIKLEVHSATLVAAAAAKSAEAAADIAKIVLKRSFNETIG